MIDAAKYSDYKVEWSRLLDFNISDIKKSESKRLEFAAAFNQFLKRSDMSMYDKIIILVFGPFLFTWSLNTLFGLGIEYSLSTWFAALVLCGGISALVSK
jgi:hypothetical protein